MWGRRARRTSQSTNKPTKSLLIILRPFLNALMLVESITCCGKLFHRSITRSEKKKLLKSSEQWFFRTLAEWPLVLVTELSVKNRQSGVRDSPLYIWKTSSKSARCQVSIIDYHLGSVWLHHWRHKGPHIPVERYCVNKSIRRVASELSSIQFEKKNNFIY